MTSKARDTRKDATKRLREAGVKGDEMAEVKVRLVPPIHDVPSQLADMVLPVDLLRQSDLTVDERTQLGIWRDQLRAGVLALSQAPPDPPLDGKQLAAKFITPAYNKAINLLGEDRYKTLFRTCQDVKDAGKMFGHWAKQDDKLQAALATTCAVCDTVGAKKCPCGRIAYCGSTCQRKDWQRHKVAEHEES